MQLEQVQVWSKDDKGRFKTGNSGGGRPKGARNKLSESFLCDLEAAWAEQGPEVIQRVIDEKPADFLRVVAGILPQKIEITSRFASLSEEEIDRAILRATAELTVISQDRMAGDAGGGREAESSAEALPISALSEAEAIP